MLVIGSLGQVGWELMRSLQVLGDLVGVSREDLDLERADCVADLIRTEKPDVIVNAAAYTSVDKAEGEAERARLINHVAPAIMAAEAKKCGSLVVHYSTDYVYDGAKSSPYVETDRPNPLNTYGATKLAGDMAVLGSGANAIVLRTSWIYASRSHNFLQSILRLASERDSLRIVSDQIGAPTTARVIADATSHILRQAMTAIDEGRFMSGQYNLVCSGKTSWYDFAIAIVDLARNHPDVFHVAVSDIARIPTSDYPTIARRPLNSCLDTLKVRSEFGIDLPDWYDALELCFQEVVQAGGVGGK